MLNPDEAADYEAWKMQRLSGQMDLSIAAYNAEMEALALAWEAGARAAHKKHDDIDSILAENPNRRKGMRGYRGDAELPAAAGTRRVTGTDEPVSET